jgi:hypothetical protein
MRYSFFDAGWRQSEASRAANRYEPGETGQESGSGKVAGPSDVCDRFGTHTDPHLFGPRAQEGASS